MEKLKFKLKTRREVDGIRYYWVCNASGMVSKSYWNKEKAMAAYPNKIHWLE